MRERLPVERQAVNHRFQVGGQKGYFTVGFYPDGRPGEIFIIMAKEGSTVSGWADSFARALSLGLQRGVTIPELVSQFKDLCFEPAGRTNNPAIPEAKSVIDYIARWFELKFVLTKAEEAPQGGEGGP